MRVLAALALALSVAACNGDDDVSAPQNAVLINTRFTLRTIDGMPLPFVLDQVGEDKLELMEAAIALGAGTFTSTSTERTTVSGVVNSQSFSENGTYSIAGSNVTFTFTTDGSTVDGAIRGDSLVFSGSGLVVVYRRE